jgi:hypothetical protein
MAIEQLLFFLFPAMLTSVAGFLVQSSLRDPRAISWWRLVISVLIIVGCCVGLGTLARGGQLGGPVALILGAVATVPILITGVWIVWSAPHWSKLIAPLIVLLIPTAFWISIQHGDAQSPEQITQRHGDRIIQALDAYHADQRSYPAALTALVPRYLPSLPDARTTQETGWLYQTDSQQYMLGYWYDPDKAVVTVCRYHSTNPSWACSPTANTVQGWAPFQIVWTPVPESRLP